MDNRSKPQPVRLSTKASFDAAINAVNGGTNIYGWEGETPKPGYYRQGSTLIEIFEQPTSTGVIGYAVPA